MQITRRNALSSAACGFGYMALQGLMSRQAAAAGAGMSLPPAGGLPGSAGRAGAAAAANPLLAKLPHFAPRAKRVIFLFMQGGPSHVDSYDYKPDLARHDGTAMPFDDARKIANSGERGTSQRVMRPMWDFRQHGQTGRWASDLFPHVNQHIDDLTFVHSLHTDGVAHGPATLFLHCGSTQFVRPSMGSWLLYGLGTENENLPGFVSIAPSAGNGGPRNYGNAFLPPVYQGTPVGKAGGSASDLTIRNLGGGGAAANGSAAASLGDRRKRFDLVRDLNAEQAKRSPGDAELDAVINSYELAWRMQMNAPDVLDVARETPATLALYGIGEAKTDTYGRQCLMARRLVEQGVRYVQVTYGDASANPAWDQHSNLAKHGTHAAAVDKPIAGLLADLKSRGLLEDTLVWWGGEFGRTPYAEKNGTGRDHNPSGFTHWMCGAGVKPGYSHGATDDFGHQAVRDKVHMHDLHATILHNLGLDHERLTYRYAGRDFRLTDVYGHVVREILT
jgi:hypothetical protein